MTNDPGSATPVVTFYFQSGPVSAGDKQRLNFGCFRFTSLAPCLTVPTPTVTGPLFANAANVPVANVSATVTNVASYQDNVPGMVEIGSVTVSSPPAIVSVPVLGLVKGAQAAATQKGQGQESCVPTTVAFVGGGVTQLFPSL